MKNISLALVCAFASFLAISGCTSPSVKRAETYSSLHDDISLARNIALYTSLTEEDGPLRDISSKDLPNNLQGASDHEMANAFDTVGLTSLGIANYNGFALPPGVSSTLAGTMGIFGGLFMPSRAPHPALRHQILAWMPKGDASNDKEAAKRLKDMIKTAFIESMPEGYTYTERKETKTPTFGAPFTVVYPTIEGPGCPNEDDLECRVWWSIGEEPMEGIAPSWSGNQGMSYAWQNWLDGANEPNYPDSFSAFFLVQYAKRDRDYGLHRNDWLKVHGHEVFHKMSEKLPKWVFLYSPPSEQSPYPAIYNSGNVNLFVK